MVPRRRLLGAEPLPRLLHLLEGPAGRHRRRTHRPDRDGGGGRLRRRAVVLDRLERRGHGPLPLRAGLEQRLGPDGHRDRDDRRARCEEHRHFGRRQVPLLRRPADGAFLHRRRHALPPDARLRLGLGLPDPHLDHLVGRRHKVRRARQPDDPRAGCALHAHVGLDGGQHPVLAADDVPFALLDGGIRRPQLRQSRRGRAVQGVQGRRRSG